MDTLCRKTGEGLWEYLYAHQIPFSKADFPWLTADTCPRILPLFDFEHYMQLQSRTEAIAYLYRGLGRTLSYIGPVLDAEMEYGFNDHTDRHTLWVAQTGLELLARAGLSFDGSKRLDLETELLMILVGVTHDVGNLVSRKGHSFYSAELLEAMFTHRDGQDRQWEAVIQAVVYHDEVALSGGVLHLDKGRPLLWALVAADKMHIGRDRVGDKSLVTGPDGSVEADCHIVLNCLIPRVVWYISGGSFVVHLDFSVDLLEEKFVSLTNQKERVWVPQMYQHAYRNLHVPYRETFAKQLTEVYGDRLALLMQAVRLLFPWLEGVKVVLSDTDRQNKVGGAEIDIFAITGDE